MTAVWSAKVQYPTPCFSSGSGHADSYRLAPWHGCLQQTAKQLAHIRIKHAPYTSYGREQVSRCTAVAQDTRTLLPAELASEGVIKQYKLLLAVGLAVTVFATAWTLEGWLWRAGAQDSTVDAVVIIGAGIAGLATAAALRKVTVTLFCSKAASSASTCKASSTRSDCSSNLALQLPCLLPQAGLSSLQAYPGKAGRLCTNKLSACHR